MGPDESPLRYWILLRLGTKNEMKPWSGPLPRHISYPEAFGFSPLSEVIAIIRNPEELLLVNSLETAQWPESNSSESILDSTTKQENSTGKSRDEE